MEVVKHVGKYLNTPVGSLCYNTDKVLTTSLDKENIEGFTSILLRLASKSNASMSQEEMLLSYQWLEHISMYMNQATTNPAFAKNFLQGINRALERNSYLTGSSLTVTDVAAYYVLHPIIERLSLSEQEALINVCRWFKNIQAQPRSKRIPPSEIEPLPPQIYPTDLAGLMDLQRPFVYFPQPFTYPHYPIVLYI